ncbi:chlorite dismutase family protein [Nitrospina gracilis]|uniref:chlorite dismutase family protein n=1 Tax=Nitrospina gracilis TaxID=35801 RepID=UPI001EFF8467|nr:chlorite dismutase family protein [Nitrospina gracilis]MCF8720451.1 chlorite dismutase [Nitrospina gracilis Nb-211]
MAIDDKELEQLMPETSLNWTEDAKARMLNVPFFVRKSVVRGIEQYARDKDIELIDDEVVSRARQEREGEAIAKMEAERKAREAQPGARRQYVNFAFYKLDSAFRRLPQAEIDAAKEEFINVLEDYDAQEGTIVLAYSTVGVRCDSEIMLWRISYEMENFQRMTTAMLRTKLGKYLDTTYSYFSQTKRSMYMDLFNPEHEEDRTHIIPGKAKYLFIYPFTKKREWYLLSKYARQGIMDEHIYVGNQYPSVKLNTTYCFGLDDYDFVVAFETDYPDDFLDLVMDLRETEGSRYTEKDTPIFSCTAMSIRDAVETLGI